MLFTDVLSDSPHPAAVKRAIELFYRIAGSYLRSHARERSLPARIGTSFDDLAYDTICYFFTRSPGGSFPILAAHFSPVDLRLQSDASIIAMTRSILARFLEDQLVRKIKESYKSVDRILRNVRNAVHASPLLHDVWIGDEHWAAIGGEEDVRSPLPVMPGSLLERALLPHAAERLTIPSLVAHVASVLSNQSTYRQAYTLNAMAVVFQNVYMLAHHYDLAGPGCGGEEINPEFERNVLRSIAEVETRMRRPLTVKEGIPRSTYAHYMRAATDILVASLQPAPEAGLSYYEILEKYMIGLNRAAYLKYHRSRLEFIVKSARQRYFDKVKNE